MNPQQKEDLRHVVLEIIATRHPTAHAAPAIRRRAANEVDFQITDEDITATLEFLKGLGCATSELDGLGTTCYWAATSAGVLAHERGRV